MARTKKVRQRFPEVQPDRKCGATYREWLESQNSLYQLTLNAIADAVMVMLPSGDITYVNPVAVKLLGRELTELSQTSLLPYFRAADGEQCGREFLERVLVLGETDAALAFIRHADGTLIPVELHFKALKIDGVAVRIIATCRDLRNEIAHQRELERQALTDRLTGCYNRWWFDEQFAKALGWAEETDGWLGLMFIDLDHFKLVNDRSYIFGDNLIATAAAAIQLVLRDTDALVRLGGDEFVLITQGLRLAKVLQIAERVTQALRDLDLRLPDDADKRFRLTASLGVSVLRGSDPHLAKILHFAQEAKRLAKELGRDRIHILPAELEERPSVH